MQKFLNKSVFEQVACGSAQINTMGYVAHPISEPGEYYGTVWKGKKETGEFRILCKEGIEAAQVDIDLFTQCQAYSMLSKKKNLSQTYRLAPGDYIMLYASQGMEGFYVTLEKETGEKREKVFDSRNLDKGDVFIAVPGRPGNYTFSEQKNGSKGRIQVQSPSMPKSGRYETPEAIQIGFSGEKFDKIEVLTDSFQGIVFQIAGPASFISVKLEDSHPKSTYPTSEPKKPFRSKRYKF